MRIIAGRAGGIRLAVPKAGVRPTMDRVKAAIFSSLGEVIMDAQILDLFAGCGALGIEALSRGAAYVLFVDEDRESISAIEKNLAKTKFQADLRKQDVFDFLRRFSSTKKFRVIFADPPYQRMESGASYTEKLLSCQALREIIEPDGFFVLEKHPSEKIPETKWWSAVRAKTYGATEVLFLRRAER
jgi:16S rRNA (guanine966-N2)-methyltransferase